MNTLVSLAKINGFGLDYQASAVKLEISYLL